MSFKFPKKNQDNTYKNRKLDPRENSYTEKLDLNRLQQFPPSFSELGKSARDLFNTGYHFGLLSLNIVTKSPNNVRFTTSFVENLNQENLFGSLEAEYELPDALVFTEKWNTDCTVTAEICFKNKPTKDFNVTLSGSLSPKNGDKKGVIQLDWANRFCSLNSQLELGSRYSLITSSVVVANRGLLGGVLAKFDAYTAKLKTLNFAAGFLSENFILHTTFSNGSECGGSIFHKISPKIEAGVDVVYSTNVESEILFGVAGRYKVDDDVRIRGKINNSSQLGLAYEQRLHEFIVLTFSALFDVRNFAEGKHKLGLSIEFEF